MARVLIIDDTETYRRYLKLELEEEGHEVETAADGGEAVIVAERFKPDLLVVDWMLRDSRDGLEVARELSASLPNMRTILITGYPSVDLRRKALDASVVRFLKKPFSLETLRRAVHDALPRLAARN